MKISKDYLGIVFETTTTLKDFYIQKQSEKTNAFINYNDNFFKRRIEIAKSLCNNIDSKNVFLISQKVQENSQLIKFEKIDLNWFSKIKSKTCTFIINKNEFYRFEIIEGERINCVYFYRIMTDKGEYVNYDSFAILMKDNELTYFPNQNENKKINFVKLLMFVELSDPQLVLIRSNDKINIGYGRDFNNKIKNDSGLNITLINTLWNKTIIVSGKFKVSGHIRIQPCGINRSEYKLIWVDEYVKDGYIRKSGKESR